MASAGSVPYKQDLPPKGGYAPINYKRIPAKSVLNAPLIYGGLFASMAYGYYQYKRGMKQVFKEEIEMKSASLAITPLAAPFLPTPMRGGMPPEPMQPPQQKQAKLS